MESGFMHSGNSNNKSTYVLYVQSTSQSFVRQIFQMGASLMLLTQVSICQSE